MRRAVPILVRQLSIQPFLTLPLEAKLSKVPIPPTMLTMEGFRFWLSFWVLFGLWFLLTQFLLTRFLSLLPKELIPMSFLNLMGFWKLSVCGGNTGGAGVVSSRLLKWFGLGTKAFLWWVVVALGYL
jgi:hypothetical protein